MLAQTSVNEQFGACEELLGYLFSIQEDATSSFMACCVFLHFITYHF